MSRSEKVEDEPLSRQEIDMEHMAQELSSLGMYEEGLTYDQMKDILSVIGESKKMAMQETENRASQESDQYSPEPMPTRPAENRSPPPRSKVREKTSTPQPSFSYRQISVASPASSSKSSLQQPQTAEESPPSPDMFEPTPPLSYRNALMDNNTSIDKLRGDPVSKNDRISKNRSSPSSSNSVTLQSDSSQGSQSTEIRVEVPSKHNQKIERWRLNPLDVSVEENDVPLQQPTRPVLRERPPFSLCLNERALEFSDKLMQSLGYHLDEVAEIWRQQRRSNVVDIQWGSPIKVGTANGSLDKKPATQHKNTTAKRGRTDSNIPERASKRRATRITEDHDYKEESESSDEVSTVKKTKKNLPNQGTAERTLTRKDKIMNSLKGVRTEKPMLLPDVDSDDDDDFNNSNLFNLRKAHEERTLVKSPTPEYPRRIIPPSHPKSNRGRGGLKNRAGRGGHGAKNELPVKKGGQKPQTEVKPAIFSESEDDAIFDPVVNEDSRKGRSDRIDDSEIAMELEDNEEEEESKEVVIKPLSRKGLSARLGQQSQRLKETTEGEERKMRMAVEEQKKKEEEKRKQKEQLARDRLQREEEKAKMEEQRERATKEREETWRRNGEARERERRLQERKKREEENKKRRKSGAEEGLLRDNDDVEVVHDTNSIRSSAESSVDCPICSKPFRREDIENHASQCDQFDSNDDRPPSRASSRNSDEVVITTDLPHQEKIYICHICNSFDTNNGIRYEEHVNKCVNRRRDVERDDTASVSAPVNPALVNVPTSPIRTFVPISKQVDSEINYQAQFPTRGKPAGSSRRKRTRNKRG